MESISSGLESTIADVHIGSRVTKKVESLAQFTSSVRYDCTGVNKGQIHLVSPPGDLPENRAGKRFTVSVNTRISKAARDIEGPMMSQKNEFHNLDNPDDGLFRDLAPGLTTRIFAGEQAMLSVVTLAPHAQGILHHHPEEQWGVLLEGSAIRVQGDEEITVKKGDFWRTPGNVPHTMRAGPQGARVLDIFSPPRPEYRKPGSGFGSS